MRRGVTVLVVVVVAGIALAAGFDALTDDGSPRAGPEPAPPSVSTTQPEGPANYVPLADELGGTLYYTDASCELQAIELPRQTPTEAPNWDECRFALSANGRRVSGEGSGWDPQSDPLIGKLFQSENGTIQVSTDRGPEGSPFPGTAPAWHPNGTLTYFSDGAVREWPSGGVVLSQRDLVRALRTLPLDELATRYDRFRVREAAWLDGRRLAAILSADGPEGRMDMLAIYHGRELDAFTFDGPGGFSELRTSPGGRYAAARSTGGRDADFVMIESGREVNTPRIVGYRALAWSPDERWVAIAADGGVFVYRPGAPGPPELELDLDAHDLAWRGEARPPAFASADEAREWVGEAGATGRLFVTQGPWTGCTLRALQFPDLTWAERPPGLPNPCRFALDASGSVLPGSPVPRPGRIESALCHQGALEWFYHSSLRARYPGACAPAWMPDGGLTFVRDGSLYQASWPDRGSRRLLSRGNVGKMLGRPSTLEEVAWVDDERFWAVVRSGGSAIVALMTTDGLVFSPSLTAETIEGLRVSATGMVAARTERGVVFFDSGGRRALTFPNGQAVAWAPGGELIAAVATPSEILIVAPLSGEIVTLPLAVKDLEWVVP